MNYSIVSMKVHQIFFKNTLRNFCYLIAFSDGAIYCIDPFQSDEVIEALKDQKLTGIINTHDHCDHHSGNEGLIARYQCSVMAHAQAKVPHKSKNLDDHEVIHQVGEWCLKSLYTPGHTMSHLALMMEKNGKPYAIFTGDCFFNAGVGHCRGGGNPEVLYDTIDTIFRAFPDELLVYPGHEYLKRNLEFTKKYEPHNQAAKDFLAKIDQVNLDETFFVNSMGIERTINTFVRLESEDLKQELNLVGATRKKVFLTLRELRNQW